MDLEGYGGMNGLGPFDLGQWQVAKLINTFADRGFRYDAGHFLIM